MNRVIHGIARRQPHRRKDSGSWFEVTVCGCKLVGFLVVVFLVTGWLVS